MSQLAYFKQNITDIKKNNHNQKIIIYDDIELTH